MAEDDTGAVSRDELLRYSSEIVASYVGRNKVAGHQLPDLITTVFQSLSNLDDPTAESGKGTQKPAISVRRSITPDYIICLEDGKKLKMLKRYLRTNFGMSPEDYRAKWGLPSDYPMVAPNYAKQRSDFAKTIGLGRDTARKGRQKRA